MLMRRLCLALVVAQLLTPACAYANGPGAIGAQIRQKFKGEVNVTGTPTDGQVLKYDAATGRWGAGDAGGVSSEDLDTTFGSTRGSLLRRGAAGWEILVPGTSGYVLTSSGAGADPTYQDKSQTLAQTLALGSTTGATEVTFSATSAARFLERASDPATVADAGKLYTKDVMATATTELFYLASDGAVSQLTGTGATGGGWIDNGTWIAPTISTRYVFVGDGSPSGDNILEIKAKVSRPGVLIQSAAATPAGLLLLRGGGTTDTKDAGRVEVRGGDVTGGGASGSPGQVLVRGGDVLAGLNITGGNVTVQGGRSGGNQPGSTTQVYGGDGQTSLGFGGSLILGGGVAGDDPNPGGPIIFSVAATGTGTNRLESMRLTPDGLLTFGGITSSQPAIKRNAAVLEVRLADDSALATLRADVLHLGGTDAILVRQSAGIIAQRNASSAQEFQAYSIYTDASNYSRLVFRASASDPVIGIEEAGSGSDGIGTLAVRSINGILLLTGTNGIECKDSHIAPYGGSQMTLGASADSMAWTELFLRKETAGVSDVIVQATVSRRSSGTAEAGLGTATRFQLEDSDGNLDAAIQINALWRDATSTSEDADLVIQQVAGGAALAEKFRFVSTGLLTFGGITSSQPALKPNGANLELRLADDSARTGLLALTGAFALATTSTADVITVSKAPSSAAAGDGISVSMGANATGDALDLTHANSAAAAVLRIANGAGSLCVLGQPSTLTFGAILAPARVVSGDARANFQLRDETAFGIDIGPGIEFTARTDAVPNVFVMATVQGCKENGTSGNTAGYFRVTTLPNGGNHTERWRVTSTGNSVVQSTSLLAWSSTASPGGTADVALGRAAANVLGIYATSTTGSTIALASGQQVRWSSTTDPAGSGDTGLARDAAGVLRVTNASTGVSTLLSGTHRNATAGTYDIGEASVGWRKVYIDTGIDTTAGDAATINKAAGRFRKDATGTTFTLTNSYITANSTVMLTLATSDVTALSMAVAAGAGTATITFNAAPTGNTDVNFFVINND